MSKIMNFEIVKNVDFNSQFEACQWFDLAGKKLIETAEADDAEIAKKVMDDIGKNLIEIHNHIKSEMLKVLKAS